ncbi:psoriasis susceptibility 1 candidate gene 2 protein-like [Penaeus chinensis]|uniref:psoriasis susceptibility 1 candidate gene 2 protein-like n=1 Tax=Penaeus chinensis TaxID=139456 RepID=UPI001FB81B86|nr:psoriasis susceptibility 1 candidate gene 2 protein-like [Penaeus chinensis]
MRPERPGPHRRPAGEVPVRPRGILQDTVPEPAHPLRQAPPAASFPAHRLFVGDRAAVLREAGRQDAHRDAYQGHAALRIDLQLAVHGQHVTGSSGHESHPSSGDRAHVGCFSRPHLRRPRPHVRRPRPDLGARPHARLLLPAAHPRHGLPVMNRGRLAAAAARAPAQAPPRPPRPPARPRAPSRACPPTQRPQRASEAPSPG